MPSPVSCPFPQRYVPAGPTDLDLARVIDSWPDLTAHIRAAVLALIATTR
jgi:hypothetical protein